MAQLLGKRSTALDVVETFGVKLAGKRALVTGANSGIGIDTARALAAAGAHVVMACRSRDKAEAVRQSIMQSYPAASLEVVDLDLTDLESVRACASGVAAAGPLHLVCLNAGVMATPKWTTKQGLEYQVGTNHFGHFALLAHLWPAVAAGMREASATDPVRVVIISSEAHKFQKGPLASDAELQQPAKYDAGRAYAASKFCNVLMAQELARRAAAQQWPLLATCLHPGVVRTDLGRDMGGLFGCCWKAFSPFMKTPAQGAATSAFCLMAPPDLLTAGAYYADCRLGSLSKQARAAEADGARLWALSEHVTGVKLPA